MELLTAMDGRTLKKADIVLAVTEAIRENREHIRDDIKVIPNGVDFELFSEAESGNREIPKELRKIPSPRRLIAN